MVLKFRNPSRVELLEVNFQETSSNENEPQQRYQISKRS